MLEKFVMFQIIFLIAGCGMRNETLHFWYQLNSSWHRLLRRITFIVPFSIEQIIASAMFHKYFI
jgi:hypothetical protein